MGLDSDEFTRFYLARYDFKKSEDSEDMDAEDTFQCLMAGLRYEYVGGTPDPAPVAPSGLYKFGWEDIVAEPRHRMIMKFKLPPAPHKNVYIKQMMMWLPIYRGYGTDVVQNEASIMCGPMKGFKFADGDQQERYNTNYEGGSVSPVQHESFRRYYSELGSWLKLDGMQKAVWAVKDESEYGNTEYPIGGDNSISEITDISHHTEYLMENVDPGGSGVWWAINFAPMCLSDGYAPGKEMELIFWAFHDLENGGVGAQENEDLYVGIYSNRNRTIFGTVPEDTDLYTDIDIDGHGRDISDKILLRPIIGIVWKRKEDKESASYAKFLTMKSVEDKAGIVELNWNPGDDIDFLKYTLNRMNIPNESSERILVSSLLDAEKKSQEVYAYPGFMRDTWYNYYMDIETYLGTPVSTIYHSNFLPVYRPVINDKYDLTPQLSNSVGNLGTYAVGKITGHDILEQLWPIVSGVDGFYTKDILDTQFAYPVKDKDLIVPPAAIAGDKYIVGGSSNTIISTTASTKKIVVQGNISAFVGAGDIIKVNAATALDVNGEYTVVSVVFVGPDTDVVVEEDIADSTGEGTFHDADGAWDVIGPDHVVNWNGASWDDLGLLDWATVYVQDESIYYTYFRGDEYRWVTTTSTGVCKWELDTWTEAQDYEKYIDVVFLSENTGALNNDYSVRRRIQVGRETSSLIDEQVISVLPPMLPSYTYWAPFRIFPIQKLISKIHFRWGDGGQGWTDEIFELIEDYGWDEEIGRFKTKDNILKISDTSFLEVGDRICIMDGMKGRTYTIKAITGNVVETTENITVYLTRRTQGYKCPSYTYTDAGDTYFEAALENEDGIIGDWYSSEYPYELGDIAPVAVLSAEQLIQEKNVDIRFIAIESVLKSFSQVFGVGNAQYNFHDGVAWLGWQNEPYEDIQWAAIGTKTVQLQVRNANSQTSPIVSIQVEIVDELVSGIYQFIDLTDFTNGYTVEDISGGREIEVESDSVGGSKDYDNSEMSIKTVSLRGVAKTHTTVHPIAVVETWKLLQPAGVQLLPDDLVTLKFLEETTYGAKIPLEGETAKCLLEPLGRVRTWGDGIKRRWNATFIVMED